MSPRRADERTSPRRRLPAPERRERVLAAALELFAEHGPQASMGDVAHAAGITRTVLYHYFPSKERLFLAVLEAQASELLRHLAPVVAGAGTQAQRARAVVDAMLAFAEERPQAWRILFEHADGAEPEVSDARRRVHDLVMTSAALLFASDMTAAGLGAGSVRTTIFGEAALGAAVAVARWWRAHPDVPRDTVAQSLFELLWLGGEGLPADAPDNH